MSWPRFARGCTPTINHERVAFTQNKRYRPNQRAIAEMVNRNAVSVYQTDQVLICIDCVQRRSSIRCREPAVTNSTEYVDVRKNLFCAPCERVLPLLRQ
jgi:hypothetical protein